MLLAQSPSMFHRIRCLIFEYGHERTLARCYIICTKKWAVQCCKPCTALMWCIRSSIIWNPSRGRSVSQDPRKSLRKSFQSPDKILDSGPDSEVSDNPYIASCSIYCILILRSTIMGITGLWFWVRNSCPPLATWWTENCMGFRRLCRLWVITGTGMEGKIYWWISFDSSWFIWQVNAHHMIFCTF